MTEDISGKTAQLKDYEKDARPSPAHEKLARHVLESVGLEIDDLSLRVVTYFLRYGYVPLTGKSVNEAANYLGSAPWIGCECTILEPVIQRLINFEIIEYSQIKELDNEFVLRISPNSKIKNKEVRLICTEIWRKTEQMIKERKNIFAPIGWTQSITTKNKLMDVLKNAPTNAVIKLMAYHGRTWLPPSSGVRGFLLDLADKHKDLHFKILIVDPKAKRIVVEGATVEENTRALASGLSNLQKSQLSKQTLDRFDVRTYGRRGDDALLRGIIIQKEDGSIVDCIITLWLFGRDRGCNGQEISFTADSNLALLCRNYFDSVFDKGWPQLGLFRQVRWILSNHWFKILTLGIIPLISIIVIISGSQFSPTAVGIMIGSFITGLRELAGLKNIWNR